MRILADAAFGPGQHRMIWNGRDEQGADVSSGVYLVRLATGTATTMHRMTLVR